MFSMKTCKRLSNSMNLDCYIDKYDLIFLFFFSVTLPFLEVVLQTANHILKQDASRIKRKLSRVYIELLSYTVILQRNEKKTHKKYGINNWVL